MGWKTTKNISPTFFTGIETADTSPFHIGRARSASMRLTFTSTSCSIFKLSMMVSTSKHIACAQFASENTALGTRQWCTSSLAISNPKFLKFFLDEIQKLAAECPSMRRSGSAANFSFPSRPASGQVSMGSFTNLKIAAYIEKLTREQASVRTELETTNNNLKTSIENVRSLEENAFSELKVEQKEDEKLWKGLESKFCSAKLFCDQLSESLGHFSGQIEHGEKELAGLRTKKEDMSKVSAQETGRLTNLIEEKDAMLNQSEVSLAAKRLDIDSSFEAEMLVSKSEEKIDALSESSRSSENEMKQLRPKMAKLEEESRRNMEQLHAEIQNKVDEVDNLQKESQKHEQEVDSLAKTVAQLQNIVQEMKELLTQVKEKEKKLEDQIVKAITEIIWRKYDEEKLEIINMEEEKVTKLLHDMERKCDQKLLEHKDESGQQLESFQKEHAAEGNQRKSYENGDSSREIDMGDREEEQLFLKIWSSFKPSTEQVLSIGANVSVLENDKEHLIRINLSKADEGGNDGCRWNEENRKLVKQLYRTRNPDSSGEKAAIWGAKDTLSLIP